MADYEICTTRAGRGRIPTDPNSLDLVCAQTHKHSVSSNTTRHRRAVELLGSLLTRLHQSRGVSLRLRAPRRNRQLPLLWSLPPLVLLLRASTKSRRSCPSEPHQWLPSTCAPRLRLGLHQLHISQSHKLYHHPKCGLCSLILVTCATAQLAAFSPTSLSRGRRLTNRVRVRPCLRLPSPSLLVSDHLSTVHSHCTGWGSQHRPVHSVISKFGPLPSTPAPIGLSCKATPRVLSVVLCNKQCKRRNRS